MKPALARTALHMRRRAAAALCAISVVYFEVLRRGLDFVTLVGSSAARPLREPALHQAVASKLASGTARRASTVSTEGWWKPPHIPLGPDPGPAQTLCAALVVPPVLLLITLAGTCVQDAESFIVGMLPISVTKMLRRVPLTWHIFSAYEFALAALAGAVARSSLVTNFLEEDGARSVSYGPSKSQRLLLFDSQTSAPSSPLVVFVHGGVWCRSRHWMYRLVGRHFQARGFATAVVGYRLYPQCTVPDMVLDLQAALAWLHENSDTERLDSSRMMLVGHSSGGHLCALAALVGEGPSLAAVATLNAPFDIVDHYAWEQGRGVGDASTLYPANGGETFFPLVSPTRIVPHLAKSCVKELPPFFLGHGEDDRVVPPSQAEGFSQVLRAAGVTTRTGIWPGLGHFSAVGALMGFPADAATEAALADLDDFLVEASRQSQVQFQTQN